MKNNKGSLIETLIAVVITAIIISLFIPTYLTIREKQEETKKAIEEREAYRQEVESEYKEWKEELEIIVKNK